MLAETGLVGREVGEDVLVETRVDDFFLDFEVILFCREEIQWRPSSLGGCRLSERKGCKE